MMTRTHMWLYVTIIYTLPYLILTTEESQDKVANALRMLNTLQQARRDITSMKRTVNNIDGELADKQKRTCNVGINSHFCSLADLDSKIRSREWLSSIYSPGKRSQGESGSEGNDKLHRALQDLVINRLNLAKLKSLLDDADADIVEQRKRTCNIGLGGACRTQWASSIADQYYYLMGPHGPGKRRRRSPIKLFRIASSSNLNKPSSQEKEKM